MAAYKPTWMCPCNHTSDIIIPDILRKELGTFSDEELKVPGCQIINQAHKLQGNNLYLNINNM